MHKENKDNNTHSVTYFTRPLSYIFGTVQTSNHFIIFLERCLDLLTSVYIQMYLLLNKGFKKELHTNDLTLDIERMTSLQM